VGVHFGFLLGPGGWASRFCRRKPGGRGWAPGHARPCRRSWRRQKRGHWRWLQGYRWLWCWVVAFDGTWGRVTTFGACGAKTSTGVRGILPASTIQANFLSGVGVELACRATQACSQTRRSCHRVVSSRRTRGTTSSCGQRVLARATGGSR